MSKLKLKFTKKTLSGFAERVLLKMQSGTIANVQLDKTMKVGSLLVPPSVLESLLALDLVVQQKNTVKINSVGEAYICRMSQLSHIARTGVAASSSAYASQHILQDTKRIKDGDRTKTYNTNIGETPLGWLFKRKNKNGKSMISHKQFLAGERLREDFELSGMSPNITLNYDTIIRSQGNSHAMGGMNVSDHAMAAKKRLNDALEDVGPGLKDVLFRVCCHLDGLEAAEKNLGWPVRSGKVVLTIALSRLVCHYNNQIG